MNHIDVIQEIKTRLRDINIISFSGGKDSTAMLQLVMEAIKGTDKKLYIVTSDTLMEIPFYQKYVDYNRQAITGYLSKSGLNAEMITVMPPWEKTFWTCTLGKGYPSSHHSFKWCTQQLKIDPINLFTEQITMFNKNYMIFVGVRQAESKRRAETYKVKDFRKNHFAPLLTWSNQDLWTYLLTESCPWGSNHKDLVQVYKYASSECLYGEQKNVCIGNARYGCWICPLQSDSQLKLISHATNNNRYIFLKEYKEKFQNMAFNWAYRSRIRRDRNPGVGPFLVTIRQELYSALKDLETATGWRLIRSEEEMLIFEFWAAEKDIHNMPNDERPLLWEIGIAK